MNILSACNGSAKVKQEESSFTDAGASTTRTNNGYLCVCSMRFKSKILMKSPVLYENSAHNRPMKQLERRSPNRSVKNVTNGVLGIHNILRMESSILVLLQEILTMNLNPVVLSNLIWLVLLPVLVKIQRSVVL